MSSTVLSPVTLGSTGLEVSAIAFGTWQLGGEWGGFDEGEGIAFRRNLEVVDRLKRFATEQLGCSVAQLAVAWTLANPAANVAIVGARHPRHIEDSLAAAELRLSEADLEQIERIMAGSVPIGGPSPEGMPSAQ
ncbi:MAG TPA: aldo/keto reductase [Solirubrobacteraceae bacterium]|nr:aldo/keto reductase [Solirubrobacteraceae bacterium]